MMLFSATRYDTMHNVSSRFTRWISNHVSLESCIKSHNAVWKKRNGIFDPDWPMIYHREHDDGNRSRSSCTCHIKSFHLRKVAYLLVTAMLFVHFRYKLVSRSRMNTFFITCSNRIWIKSNFSRNDSFSSFWKERKNVLYLVHKRILRLLAKCVG